MVNDMPHFDVSSIWHIMVNDVPNFDMGAVQHIMVIC